NALTGRPVTWSSSNTAVATVSSTGLVSGVAQGSATITATSEGKSGIAALTVIPVVATVTVSPATASITVGSSRQLTATPRDAAGNALTGRAVTWSSSNTAVATVSSTGLVSGVAQGSATITATSEGASGTSSITVTPPDPCLFVNFLPIAPGQTVNGVLTSTDCRRSDGSFADGYRLTVASGTTIAITLRTTAFRPWLELIHTNGVTTTTASFCTNCTERQITRTIAAGSYYVLVNSYGPGETGAYELSIAVTSGSIAETPEYWTRIPLDSALTMKRKW
ncbi:MAG TPA: Ig-like domain-containing protein, partial [Longimicrobiales bacterium]|nr:Ig-like domain-containing protein [Longimicrobiales bacterium]